MTLLDNTNRRFQTKYFKDRRWDAYFAGAVIGTIFGFATWITLLAIWPKGRWQILGLPDMFGVEFIGEFVFMAISGAIYRSVASTRIMVRIHLLLGIFASNSHLALANCMARIGKEDSEPSGVIVSIYFGGLFLTPILLGLLSRRYAKKTNRIQLTRDLPAQQ